MIKKRDNVLLNNYFDLRQRHNFVHPICHKETSSIHNPINFSHNNILDMKCNTKSMSYQSG